MFHNFLKYTYIYIYEKTCLQNSFDNSQRQLHGRRDCLVQYFTSSRSKFCTSQPYFNFIAVLFKTKKQKNKTPTNYHLVEKQTHHLNSQVQHWISPCLLGFWTLWLLCHFPIYIPFFVKSDPPVLFWVFFAWKGTECHKLPFPVISNVRWKTHWVAHRLLTSRHTHFQSTVFLCEQFKLHSYLSLENGFLYIFLVCQCLGVFLFLYYGVTLIFSNFQLFLSHL